MPYWFIIMLNISLRATELIIPERGLRGLSGSNPFPFDTVVAAERLTTSLGGPIRTKYSSLLKWRHWRSCPRTLLKLQLLKVWKASSNSSAMTAQSKNWLSFRKEESESLYGVDVLQLPKSGPIVSSVNYQVLFAEAVPMMMRSHNVEPMVPLSLGLPPLRKADNLTEAETRQALRRLHEFSYYPIPEVLELPSHDEDASAPDSGYVSENEVDEVYNADKALPMYLDPLERDFAVRWLTGFIGQAWEISLSDETRDQFVDAACSLLSHLNCTEGDGNAAGEDPGMTRRFRFSTGDGAKIFVVELYDTPMQTGEDHTDVGLQTWGASIALSHMFCKAPMDFNLTPSTLDSSTRIVELGAGTGLVSLVLASLLPSITNSLPSIVATDYHPTVLKNLQGNASSHGCKAEPTALVQVAHLDWCAPTRQPPLDVPANMIIAADVVYAAEHARWLRHCAAHILAPDGIFWLMVSIRPNGKFAGVCDSIEAIFAEQDMPAPDGCRHLEILNHQWIDKKHGIGRADEIGYKLFKIGWA
ncbi:hypothetical protein Trco_007185 [Trichoderma cornu-damae]|uniref:Methyltransferase n=1 Tax=Trichoderma cornu-damae TaxID=654480 RepID=A0A9P8TSV8_9HYPO|nr:hypothetical protein Trco_007185 [Trichoderma cornu-damae]